MGHQRASTGFAPSSELPRSKTCELTNSIICGSVIEPIRRASRNKSSAATVASALSTTRCRFSRMVRGRVSPMASRRSASMRYSRTRSRSFSSASDRTLRHLSRCFERITRRSSPGLPNRAAHSATIGSNRCASQARSMRPLRSATSLGPSSGSSSRSHASIAPLSAS